MPKKRFKGIVVKKSGDKTYKVRVVISYRHPKYKKEVKKFVHFLAHFDGDINPGEEVVIEECRRLSKNKHFRILKNKDNVKE